MITLTLRRIIVSLSSNDGYGSENALEHKHMRNGDYFVITASCSHFLLLTKKVTNELVGPL